jgi:hypothetical protein
MGRGEGGGHFIIYIKNTQGGGGGGNLIYNVMTNILEGGRTVRIGSRTDRQQTDGRTNRHTEVHYIKVVPT